ncbi:retrotransposon-related protein [Tanacetum coccineum]
MAMVQAPDFQSMRIGAVLQQGGHPIAYFSKSLSLKHQALSTYEKEFYAVIMAIEKWKGYLLDRHFKIKTDHFRLKYLLDQRFTTPFWAKWLPKLLGYDYEISYKKRSENTLRPIGKQDLKLLIKQLEEKTDTVNKYTWINNELRRKGKLVVSNDDQLRKQLLTYFHCDPIGGHSGVQTFLPVPTKVWNDISMDFIEALPPSQGKTVFFVVVDKLSKYAYFIPMSHLFTASQVAQVFLDHVYKLYAKGMGQMGILSRILVQYQFSYLCPRPLPMRVYDQPPNVHLPYLAGTSSIEEVVRTMQAREQAIAMLQFHLKRFQERMKNMANKHISDRNFEVGMKVNLKLQPYRQTTVRQGTHHKFGAKFYGPFLIIAKVGKVAYKLQLPKDSQIQLVFHVFEKLCKGTNHQVGISMWPKWCAKHGT